MNPKFMVVDDDADTLTLIASVLQTMQCDVEQHSRGESALESLTDPKRAAQFDAIFLDIMMPGLSGLAVLERLRMMGHTKDLPVVMLTAKGSSEEVVEGYRLGASYYIPKPFTTEQIVFALDMLLGDAPDEDGNSQKPAPVHKLEFNPDIKEDSHPSGVMLPPQSDRSTK